MGGNRLMTQFVRRGAEMMGNLVTSWVGNRGYVGYVEHRRNIGMLTMFSPTGNIGHTA